MPNSLRHHQDAHTRTKPQVCNMQMGCYCLRVSGVSVNGVEWYVCVCESEGVCVCVCVRMCHCVCVFDDSEYT